MINFNRDDIISNGELIYRQRAKIEEIADEICTTGFDLLFFTSSGGSYAMLQPFMYYLNTMSKLMVDGMVSADYLAMGNNRITNKTIAFMASKSGDTKETIEAAKDLKQKGVRIFSLIAVENSLLEELSDYSIVYQGGRPQELAFYLLIGKIMYNKGFFADYNKFADELKYLATDLADVRIVADEKCLKYAQKYCNDPYNIFVASGDLWPTAYSFSMCVMEESLWLRTKSVSSPEFFHGTIELLDKNVCLTLLISEGKTRALDERVKSFALKHTDELNCFDCADYEMAHFSNQFRELLSPVIMNAVLQRISKNMEVIKNHDLTIRRYYRKEEY